MHFHRLIVALGLCLLLTGVAMAQTVPGSLTLKWTADDRLPGRSDAPCLRSAHEPVPDAPADAAAADAVSYFAGLAWQS